MKTQSTRSKPRINSPAAAGLRSRAGRSKVKFVKLSYVVKQLLKMGRYWLSKVMEGMFGSDVMKLETERLILRDFVADDWQRVLEYQSDPLYLRYNTWTERTPEAVQEF